MTHVVPQSVRAVARQALEAHQRTPDLPGVRGVVTAQALARGEVDDATAARVYRFLSRNARLHEAALNQLWTEADNAVVRSYLLHGGVAARGWAEDIFKQAVTEGRIDEDPVTELFSLQPDQIYDRFQLGAWKYEYGMDSRKAARFVEHYTRATGLPIELPKAFGSDAPNVSHALLRRLQIARPVHEQLVEFLADDDYKLAAYADMAEINHGMSVVSESLVKKLWQDQPMVQNQIADLAWGTYLAYAVLAVEDPEKLDALSAKSKPPPGPAVKPKPYTQYHDAINIYATFFHPEGKRYVAPDADSKAYADLDAAEYNWQFRTYKGLPVKRLAMWKHLSLRRRFMATHSKIGAQLFHTLLQAWKKEDYQKILDNIPVDSDLYLPFSQFVSEKSGGATAAAPPTGDGKTAVVPQALDKAELLSAAAAGEPGPEWKVVGIGSTAFYSHVQQKAKYALKVGDVMVRHGEAYTIVGVAFNTQTGDAFIGLRKSHLVTVVPYTSSQLIAGYDAGEWAIQGVPATPQKMSSRDYAAQLTKYLKDHQQFQPGEYKVVPMSQTKSYAAAGKLGVKLQPGTSFTFGQVNKYTGVIVGAYKETQGPLSIALTQADANGGTPVEVSMLDDVLAAEIANGKAKFQGGAPTLAGGHTGTATDPAALLAAVDLSGGGKWIIVPLEQTELSDHVKAKLGHVVKPGDVVTTKEMGDYEFIGAAKNTVIGSVRIGWRPVGGSGNKVQTWPPESFIGGFDTGVWKYKDTPATPTGDDDKYTAAVKEYLTQQGLDPTVVQLMPMADTKAYKEARKKGLKLSPGSQVQGGDVVGEIQGAYKGTAGGTVMIVYRIVKGVEPGKLIGATQDQFLTGVDTGTLKQVVADKATDTPVAPQQDAPDGDSEDDVIKQFIDAYIPDYLEEVSFVSTDANTAWYDKHEDAITVGTDFYDGTTTFTFVRAFKRTDGSVYILYMDDEGAMDDLSDEEMTAMVKKGTIMPAPDKGSATTPNADSPPSGDPANDPATPYEVGDVLSGFQDNPVIVLAAYNDGTGQQYVLAPLMLSSTAFPKAVSEPFQVAHAAVSGVNVSVVAKGAVGMVSHWKFAVGDTQTSATPAAWGVKQGEQVNWLGKKYIFVTAAEVSGVLQPVCAIAMTWLAGGKSGSFLRYVTLPVDAVFAPKGASSYAPEGPKPESPDAFDAASTELCGTQAALDYIQKKGWKPAYQSESPLFKWDLGVILQYNGKTRTVIGYAFDAKADAATYVTVTDVGNVSFKAAKNGNTAYGPPLGSDATVVSALLPKPEDAAIAEERKKYPDLNYGLSKHAIEVAKANDLTYVASPKGAPFYVGTRIKHKASGNLRDILGVMNAGTADNPDLAYVLAPVPEKRDDKVPATSYVLTGIDVAGAGYTINYDYDSSFNEDTGEVTFGKGDDLEYGLAIPGSSGEGEVLLPSDPPAGWNNPTPIKQPALSSLGSGHVSAGVVAIIPPEVLSAKAEDADDMHESPHAMFVMRYPLNQYGGTKLSFPKGTVDEGESIEDAAVRECWEETGLTMKPIAWLGDYKGKTSVTRMFIGYVTGGNPKASGKETDAVVFKPFDWLEEGGPDKKLMAWYDDLTTRDKKIVDDAFAWLEKKGAWPNELPIEQAPYPSMVTGPQDLKGQGKVKYNPKAEYAQPDDEPFVGSITDYTVDADVRKFAAKQYAAAGYTKTAKWVAYKDVLATGNAYPPPGAVAEIDGKIKLTGTKPGDIFTIEGYVSRVRETSKASMEIMSVAVRPVGEGELHLVKLLQRDTDVTDWDVIAPASVFIPVVTDKFADISPKSLRPSKSDPWNALITGAPFPVTSTMLGKMKYAWGAYSLGSLELPVGFRCAKNRKGFPPFGSVVVHTGLAPASAPPSEVLGYVDVGAPNDGQVYKYVTQNEVTKGGTLEVIDHQPYVRWVVVSDITSGEVRVWAAGPAMEGKIEVQAELDASHKYQAAFLSHPDPDINAAIQKLAGSGGDLSVIGTSFETVQGWMEAAHDAVAWDALTLDLLSDAAMAFVPGGMSAHQFGAFIGALNAKKTAVATEKAAAEKVAKAAEKQAQAELTAASEDVTVITPPAPSTYSTAAQPDYASPTMLLKMAHLEPAKLTTGGGVQGGSNPVGFVKSPDGTEWFAKGSKEGAGSPWSYVRASADEASATLIRMLNPDMPAARMVDLSDNANVPPNLRGPVTLQTKIPATEFAPKDVSKLSSDDVVTILRQHVIDMFVGDHDGKFDNWLRLGGKLVPIDRSQAFRFLAEGKAESLDPSNNMGNHGRPLAKLILEKWRDDPAYAIPQAAFNAMRDMVAQINETMTDAVLEQSLTKYFDYVQKASGTSAKKKVLDGLKKRRDGYHQAWGLMLNKLASPHSKKFTWPAAGVKKTGKPAKKSAVKKITATAAEMNFTPEIAQDLDDAAKAGWQGKSIRIDTHAIENQEVLVQPVTATPGNNPYTLLSWKVAFHAAAPAIQKLKAVMIGDPAEGATSLSGPQRFPFDQGTSGYIDRIIIAAKFLNNRFYDKVNPDADAYAQKQGEGKTWQQLKEKMAGEGQTLTPEMFADPKKIADRIDPVLAMLNQTGTVPGGLPTLPALLDAASTSKKVTVQGAPYPASAIVGMAQQYTQYAEIIRDVWTDIVTHGEDGQFWGKQVGVPAGDKVVHFSVFEFNPDDYKDDVAQDPVSVDDLPFYVLPKSTGGTMPQLQPQLSGPGQPPRLTMSLSGGSMAGVSVDVLGNVMAAGPKFPQFVIREKSGPTHIFVVPNFDPFKGYGGIIENRSMAGTCWAVIPGEPSPVNVAKVMKLFEQATDVPMKAASDKDVEALYWSKQASMLQPQHPTSSGSWLHPQGEGVAVSNPAYAAALEQYRSGKTDVAITALKTFVAEATKRTVSAIEKDAKKGLRGVHDAGGVGYRRTLQVGWTREKLQAKFGDMYVGHGILTSNLNTFFTRAIKNGALLANAARPLYGITVGEGGASPGADLGYGGGSNLFMALMRGSNMAYNAGKGLFFDISLLLRDDVMIIGASDAFGNITEKRLVSIESLLDNKAAASKSQHFSSGMSYQVNARFDVNLRAYLQFAVCSDNAERDKIRGLIETHWGPDTTFGPDKKSIDATIVTTSGLP